jgi:hypothetical protein
MRSMTFAISVFAMATAAAVFAQEAVPTPAPLEGQQLPKAGDSSDSILVVSGSAARPPASLQRDAHEAAGNPQMFRIDGRWWYQMPDRHWMWYDDASGQWVASDVRRPPPRGTEAHIDSRPIISPRGQPAVSLTPSPGGFNVNTGRVNVNIAGRHGSVQVGRLGWGW